MSEQHHLNLNYVKILELFLFLHLLMFLSHSNFNPEAIGARQPSLTQLLYGI